MSLRKLIIVTKTGKQKKIQDGIDVLDTDLGYPYDSKCLLHPYAYEECPVTGFKEKGVLNMPEQERMLRLKPLKEAKRIVIVIKYQDEDGRLIGSEGKSQYDLEPAPPKDWKPYCYEPKRGICFGHANRTCAVCKWLRDRKEEAPFCLHEETSPKDELESMFDNIKEFDEWAKRSLNISPKRLEIRVRTQNHQDGDKK